MAGRMLQAATGEATTLWHRAPVLPAGAPIQFQLEVCSLAPFGYRSGAAMQCCLIWITPSLTCNREVRPAECSTKQPAHVVRDIASAGVARSNVQSALGHPQKRIAQPSLSQLCQAAMPVSRSKLSATTTLEAEPATKAASGGGSCRYVACPDCKRVRPTLASCTLVAAGASLT